MRNLWMAILAGLAVAVFASAADKQGNLGGTWVLDSAHSDSPGQTRRSNSRLGGLGGILLPGGYPGGGYPGGGYPGGGYPRGGYPGGGYPGGGYPGGGYPGGTGRTGGGYPGPDGGDGGEQSGGEFPRGQMQDLKIEIVQTDSDVQTTRKFTMNGEDRTITQKFLLDGSENRNPGSNGRGEYISTSTWKSGKLVNAGTQNTSDRGQDFSTSVKEEYSLSKDGKVLTIRTTRTTPRGSSTTLKQVFNRQDT